MPMRVGGIDAAGDLGNAILITGLGWICSSIYLGIALKKVTGKKKACIRKPGYSLDFGIGLTPCGNNYWDFDR